MQQPSNLTTKAKALKISELQTGPIISYYILLFPLMRYSSGRFQEFRFRLDQADDHGIPTSSLAGSFSMWPGALMRQSGCFEKGPNIKLRHKTIKPWWLYILGYSMLTRFVYFISQF